MSVRCLQGITGLLASKKGVLSLIILACATVALFFGKLDGMAYAAVIGTIGTIYCFVAYKTDTAYGSYGNYYPTTSQLGIQPTSANLYSSSGGQHEQGPGT